MAKTHELKTLPIYFDAVKRGDKTFEIRNNDRDFQAGDTLILCEYDPAKHLPAPTFEGKPSAPPVIGAYTGQRMEARVSYVLHDTFSKFGIERGFVVLGLRDVKGYAEAPAKS